jgi:hypothetical protein
MRNNLILASVGDESVHRSWLSSASRTFDVALVYFGDRPGRFREDADYYVARKGIKYSLLHDVAQNELDEILFRYSHVWMPDDDIAAETPLINELFRLAAVHGLAICQPAIGAGDVSFKALRAQPEYLLRYSRFVEIMCPLFSREALRCVLPTFKLNVSAWGIDWLWASMFGPQDLAVIDATPVHHTRPLSSGGVHRRLAMMGIDPRQELQSLIRLRGINNRRVHRAMCHETSRFWGIRRDGRKAWRRSLLSTFFPRLAA